MSRDATTAALSVKREDALAEHGHNPIDAVVHDPIGFPMDQFDRVLEVVQANYDADELVNGERVFMPGADHESLNNALQRRRMQPVSPPTVRGYGGEKSAGLGFGLGMDGDGFL